MFSGDFAAKPVGSFAQAFSKACRSRRDRRSRSQARNSFILPKRHRRVNFRQRRTEGNRTSGGFPLCNKANLNFMSAFFFETKGAKKKAWQKRTRRKRGFAACARRPTLRALDQRELLEKLDQNFQQTRREVTYKSKFELYYFFELQICIAPSTSP